MAYDSVSHNNTAAAVAFPALSLISSKPPAVIFDIDGTLANGEHRQHHVRRTNPDGTKRKPHWAAYNAGIADDKLIPETRSVLMGFYGRGLSIILCSGREAIYRDVTETWCARHQIPYHELFMRPEKDYRPDYEIKEEILDRYILPSYSPLCVFDDRKQVKRMWVRRGIFVFDVNQHDEEF